MSLVRKNFDLEEGVGFDCCAVVTSDNRLYCKLKELSDLLGYAAPHKAYKLIDDKWKATWAQLAEREGLLSPPECGGGSSNWQPTTIFVSEPGIYSLVLRSRKPEAVRFRDHVLEVVLPEIRRTGAYVSPDVTASQAEGIVESLREQAAEMDRMLTETRAEVAERDRMLAEMRGAVAERDRMLADETRQRNRLQTDLANVRPKVAVIPDRAKVRQTLSIYRNGNVYRFIRTQKRSLGRALRRLPEGFRLAYYVDHTPNALNIVNRLKETLPRNVFRKYNTVVSDVDVVEIVDGILKNEIDRPMTSD